LGRRKYGYGRGESEWLDLFATDLRGAFFRGAHLEGANLRGAHLEGAHLGEITGLTQEQLADAIPDEKTRLPDYLKEQPPEATGTEKNQEE
jgi:uncharacterized protein YjbI with pentapeptide repeats